MAGKCKIKRALISVSDKSGLVELAHGLESYGIEIISTGGTLKAIRDGGVQVISITSFTGSPEVMGGRVKTLHPKVHGAILYRRDNSDDVRELAELESKGIDLVIVNLYPFEETMARENISEDELIENIDIGGPSMLRSAAKNFESVTVVTDPADYDRLLNELKENDGAATPEFRRFCSGKAFELTAVYDRAIAYYFAHGIPSAKTAAVGFDKELSLNYSLRSSLRYGENPHQEAAIYAKAGYSGPTLLDVEILSGKELSFNNYNDLEACLGMLMDFDEPFACVLKHANPCGAATADNIAESYRMAYESDPLSAFGSIIGLNRNVDMACAEILHETPFVECILAPSFDDDALKKLKRKKNRRLLSLPSMAKGVTGSEWQYKYFNGGLLAQSADNKSIDVTELTTVSARKATEAELKSLLFAWKVVKHTKSNAIVLAAGTQTVGIGMGQTSRVDSGFMAVKRAGTRSKGSVMASDAFFPMADGVEVALEAGVTAIIQPGGSKGDEDVIKAVDKAGAAMVFTGVRHFKH